MAEMKFVSRAGWGSSPLRSPAGSNITPQNGGVTCHWEGPRMGWPWPHSLCDDKVRSIQRFHIRTRGWADIAYSALVCGHGYTFEGRWLGRRTAANGTNSGNQNWYAVCYLGGQGDEFTAEGRVGMRATVEYLWAHGARNRVNGHRDHKATECPGDIIYAWLRAGMPISEDTMTPAEIKQAVIDALDTRLPWRSAGVAKFAEKVGASSTITSRLLMEYTYPGTNPGGAQLQALARIEARLGALEGVMAAHVAADDTNPLTVEQVVAASREGAAQALAAGVDLRVTVDDQES